ncbi:MAG: glycosyl transferase [Gemmatimonadetes bacterium]|nr:glycosyl transferase [Gemmatimonadota bacterium]
MTEARVSVLLPVYNAERTLQEALDTLTAQTLGDFEVVAVNDGSTDRTADILDRAAAHDDRIRILNYPHRGLIDSLNDGIVECRAPLIARFDADDRARPHRLERQVAYLDRHPGIAAVGCQVHCFSDTGIAEGFRVYEAWINGLLSPEEIAREIFIESPLVHPSVTIRRSILDEVGGYMERGWAEDYDLWLRIHGAGHPMAKIPEALHEWRDSQDRLTRTDGRYSVENFLRAKAYYLTHGPLRTGACIIWGAGQMGRRLSKHLLRAGVRIPAFVDIDPKKIGNTRRGAPIISPNDLERVRADSGNPVLLASVPSRGARDLIRRNLDALGMVETVDYWCVA